jgi:glycosyltransferase involved in cell wall biosynthesis
MRKKKIKVSHIVFCAPHTSGMYETARELVLAERELGINAHIVDPNPYPEQAKLKDGKPIGPVRPPDWFEDRGVCIAPKSWVTESDVIVSHSGLFMEEVNKTKAPCFHIMHGRPRSSFLIEHYKQTPILSYYRDMAKNKRVKQFITFWPEYKRYWEMLFPKVTAMDSFVDLDYWCPGDSTYDFNGLGGDINVVVTDRWRFDKDPFHVINAFVVFAEKYPKAKIHLYGCDVEKKDGKLKMQSTALLTMVNCLREKGIVGEVNPSVGHLRDIYRAADMVITPHTIAVRTVREVLATGCQVVAGLGNRFTPYTANIEDLEGYASQMERAYKDKDGCIKRNRAIAEKHFQIKPVAEQFVKLFREAIAA